MLANWQTNLKWNVSSSPKTSDGTCSLYIHVYPSNVLLPIQCRWMDRVQSRVMPNYKMIIIFVVFLSATTQRDNTEHLIHTIQSAVAKIPYHLHACECIFYRHSTNKYQIFVNQPRDQGKPGEVRARRNSKTRRVSKYKSGNWRSWEQLKISEDSISATNQKQDPRG